MHEYVSLQGKRGSSIRIQVDQDVEIIFTLEDVDTLCELFIKGKLGQHELTYIADVIELAANVSYIDDDTAPIIAEFVSEMTDPAVMGVFTTKRAQEVPAEIKSM